MTGFNRDTIGGEASTSNWRVRETYANALIGSLNHHHEVKTAFKRVQKGVHKTVLDHHNGVSLFFEGCFSAIRPGFLCSIRQIPLPSY